MSESSSASARRSASSRAGRRSATPSATRSTTPAYSSGCGNSERGEGAERYTLHLPLPPSVNTMLGLAMKRTRRTRTGGWSKRAMPGVVYDQHHEAYVVLCEKAIREAGIRKPRRPWCRWRLVELHFRLFQVRDWLELAAGAKWTVDFLKTAGFVADDSPREMARPEAWPTQEVRRKDMGVTVTIERLTHGTPWCNNSC